MSQSVSTLTNNRSLSKERARACLINLFIGDALSMPVHWFYNPGDIVREFGAMGVRDMHPAPQHHPSSIMVLHSTKSGGRRAVEKRRFSGEVVGDVILHGKRELWGKPGTHYHHNMPAGENTLNAWWARELLDYLLEHDGYDINTWVQRYINFMTANPARHPDTYAESCHRSFFANYAAGVEPLKCGAVTHDTPSMGALVTVAPLVIALNRDYNAKELKAICRRHVHLTHPDNGLMNVVDAYVELLLSLLSSTQSTDSAGSMLTESAAGKSDNAIEENSTEEISANTFSDSAKHAESYSHTSLVALQQAINATGRVELEALVNQKRGDAAIVGQRYSLACYISDSWPSVCYLAGKYINDVEKALVVNTNLGGENAHRGAVLGTIVGAATAKMPNRLKSQLAHEEALVSLAEKFLNKFLD